MMAESRSVAVRGSWALDYEPATVVRVPWPSALGALVRRTAAFAGDAALLLLLVFLFPVVVLLIGMPIALLLWAVGEIAARVF